MVVPSLATTLACNYRIERELGSGGKMWLQFSNSPAWAPFRADAEGAAMLRTQGFA